MRHGVPPRIFAGAGGPQSHRGHRLRLCELKAPGEEPGGPVPLSQREDRVLQHLPGEQLLLLLRLQQGGRRDLLRHGGGEPGLPRGRAVAGPAGWDGRSRGRGGRQHVQAAHPHFRDQPGVRQVLLPPRRANRGWTTSAAGGWTTRPSSTSAWATPRTRPSPW